MRVPFLFRFTVTVGMVLFVSNSAWAQNLFEVDAGSGVNGSGKINEFTSSGVGSVFATGLTEPNSLAFNSAGDLFVANIGSQAVYEYQPGGQQSTFATALDPYSLAFNSAGVLFVGSGDGDILELTTSGAKSTFASGVGFPVDLAFNSAGDLFEVDRDAGNINEFTPNGSESTFASGLSEPWGLAFDSAGNLFVGCDNGYIYEFAPNGSQSTFAALSAPYGMAFDRAGDLFVGTGAGSIYEFSTGGRENIFVSGVNNPYALAFQNISLPVPEPSALEMLMVGALGLFASRRTIAARIY